MNANIKRDYKQYHRQRYSISDTIGILKELIWLEIKSSSALFKSQKQFEGNQLSNPVSPK